MNAKIHELPEFMVIEDTALWQKYEINIEILHKFT